MENSTCKLLSNTEAGPAEANNDWSGESLGVLIS